MTATATPSSVRRLAAAVRRRRWRRWSSRSVIVAVVAAAVVVGGAAYAALGTDVLSIKSVSVDGTRDVPPSAVLAAAGVPLGAPMARLNGGAVRDRVLAALPAVAAVTVERKWPSTVRLVVRERTAAAAVPQNGRYLVVDRAGAAFRTSATVPAGAVILRVRTPYRRDAAAIAGLAVLDSLPAQVRRLVARVDAPTAEQVVLTLRDNRKVVWGGANDAAAKGAVARVLLGRPGQVIDVSAPGLATVR